MKKIFLLFCYCSLAISTYGLSISRDSLYHRFYFRVGSFSPDLSFQKNASQMDSILLNIHLMKGKATLNHILVVSSASPVGNTNFNRSLSIKRGLAIRSLIQKYILLPDSLFVLTSLGQDWEGLSSLVRESDMPYKEEVLHILYKTPEWIFRNKAIVDGRKKKLMMLHGGDTWRYMQKRFFPELCNTTIKCEFVFTPLPKNTKEQAITEIKTIENTVLYNRPNNHDSILTNRTLQDSIDISPKIPDANPFYMSLKSNLLYDALLIPNIGLEFYLGKEWYVSGNWMYSWWKNDRRHYYWRVYGGDLEIRKYLGRRASEKPLTGHHLGLYFQLLTYDFELGGRGYQGGRWSYGMGLNYGYSLPIGRRLNLDFGIGLGYLGGKYKIYTPKDNFYVWQKTKQRNLFGITKAEVSLIWLLGHGNHNIVKGGAE